jgi:spermidine synthase
LKFVHEAPTGAYDLILVDSTDPAGPGKACLPSALPDCFRALSEKGIQINQHEGAFFEGDIEEMKKAHAKIKKTFPIAKYSLQHPNLCFRLLYFGFASKCFDPVANEAEALEAISD